MKTLKETVKTVFIANEEFTTRNGKGPTNVQCTGYKLELYGKYTNGRTLYDECRRVKPDIIVSDIFLDELDLLTIIKKFQEDFYEPMVIAIGPKNSVFVDMALNNGCKYYMSGSVHNDAIITNIQLLADSDIRTEDAERGVITSTDYIDSIVEEKLLHEFGIPYSILGFMYLKEAITYVIKNGETAVTNVGITKEVYPYIAKKYSTTSSRVERNIRTAVEKACSNAGLKTIEKYFGKSCNEYDEKPTNSLFVCTVARRILGEYTFSRD